MSNEGIFGQAWIPGAMAIPSSATRTRRITGSPPGYAYGRPAAAAGFGATPLTMPPTPAQLAAATYLGVDGRTYWKPDVVSSIAQKIATSKCYLGDKSGSGIDAHGYYKFSLKDRDSTGCEKTLAGDLSSGMRAYAWWDAAFDNWLGGFTIDTMMPNYPPGGFSTSEPGAYMARDATDAQGGQCLEWDEEYKKCKRAGPVTTQTEGQKSNGLTASEPSWWSKRSTAEKAGMIGGAAVIGLGAIWLIAR